MRRIVQLKISNRRFAVAGLLVALWLTLVSTSFATAPAGSDGGVLFSLTAPEAEAVFIAGSFNGWNAAELPLTKGDAGLWAVTIPLAEGEWEYKFIVDGNWLQDPQNPEQVVDPFGGANSLVTVAADGSVAGIAIVAGTTAGAATSATDDLKVGAPHKVETGIAFSYHDQRANQVFLAGSMNDWNAENLPLKNDGQGNWFSVQPLAAGEFTYKFVVDNNWVVDPENPTTKPDGYGGNNSLVTVDDGGNVVASAAVPSTSAIKTSFGDLNAKVSLSGRYLTRMEMAKLTDIDPRYRLHRPSQNVDLNITTEVSGVAQTFMRLRMDSNQNVILNNINSVLDEAQLFIDPGKFTLKAYWNQETYTMGDIMKHGGDIDHPATIGHDHLDFGKGTAGMLFTAEPLGVNFRGFFANVHNFDYYNDPDLYDNTGGDRIGMRFSRKFGSVEIGLPIWLERELLWLNFTDSEADPKPPTVDFPTILDDYFANSGDSSVWFETEAHNYEVGIDVRMPLQNDEIVLGAEAIVVDTLQRLVTGNRAGPNNSNGSIDVPFLERTQKALRAQVEWRPNQETYLLVDHTYSDMSGGQKGQGAMGYSFLPIADANKQIQFGITDSPAQIERNLSELILDHKSAGNQLKLWLWRDNANLDHGVVGSTVPDDTTRTTHNYQTIYLSGLVGHGQPTDKYGHLELEFGLKMVDPDVARQKMNSFEFITRYDRNLTTNLGVVADIRFIHYTVESENSDTGDFWSRKEDYVSPFLGLRYNPIPTLELVFGYGLDPEDFSIDYSGRQFGRWWYRQNFLFDNPEANLLDAEQYLADSRIFTLRAQLTF